jgi:hypothetical protein
MGYSSELMIAEANRNEATEAFDLIGAVHDDLVVEWGNTDDDEQAEVYAEWRDKLAAAMKLIEKFSAKHQPELQRYK